MKEKKNFPYSPPRLLSSFSGSVLLSLNKIICTIAIVFVLEAITPEQIVSLTCDDFILEALFTTAS